MRRKTFSRFLGLLIAHSALFGWTISLSGCRERLIETPHPKIVRFWGEAGDTILKKDGTVFEIPWDYIVKPKADEVRR